MNDDQPKTLWRMGEMLTPQQHIEIQAAVAHEEIRTMARNAIEHINRSIGQHLRYARERFDQITVETQA